ncbi:MAG: RNase adapter RapZ [Deltaproteobacteria bacterium]|nr:RNase adapter RapZ [Deltaproteobacteria bacterium]
MTPQTDDSKVEKTPHPSPSLVIITGLSGAGKSTAMRVFDDLGYYCLDNLPPALILDFYRLYMGGSTQKKGVAIASDMRSGTLFDDFTTALHRLNDESIHFALVYLDCETDVLMKRFKEVRRAHPLEPQYTLRRAISEERRRLAATLDLATHVIDTTQCRASQLRQLVLQTVLQRDTNQISHVKVFSFGYKYGVPRDADYVFDVRFLPNPFYLENLRPLTGEDEQVYNYVMNHDAAEQFFQGIVTLINPTFDAFIDVGKFTVAIAFGCTGGHHRSVAFAKRLAAYYGNQNRLVQKYHRDIANPL